MTKLTKLSEAENLLKEVHANREWLLMAPDGRIWRDTNPMLISAAILAELGGYAEPLGAEFSQVLQDNLSSLYER